MQNCSCPLVVWVSGLDSLESPEIILVEGHWLGVSSSEALRNPGVVEALSVTESKISDGTTNNSTEEDAREGEHDVCIEGDGVDACLGAEVPPAEGGTSKGWRKECVASEDGKVGRIAETNVEEVGVVLDEIDRSNSELEIFVCLRNSMRVCVLMVVVAIVAIVTHIY